MRKFMLILMAVALLAGCVSAGSTQQIKQDQQRGTAEIIERDGGKWVHVLGTGVVFPLLGAWEDAAFVVDAAGMTEMLPVAVGTTRSAVIISTDNDLSGMTYSALKSGGFSPDAYGKEYCESIGSQFVRAAGSGYEDLYIRCTGEIESGMVEHAAFIFGSDGKKKTLISYWGSGVAHAGHFPIFQEMMRRVEVNP